MIANVARKRAGFTLIEVLVVMTIIVILALVGLPSLQQLIIRNKLLGVTRNISIHLQLARQEAVREGREVVVRADFVTDEVITFVNENGDADHKYEPGDREINRVGLPTSQNPAANIYFMDPANGPEGADAIDGFSDADGERVAVFRPDGSILAIGAFRVGDGRGNIFEVRVEPAATAQVAVLKFYKGAPPWGDASSADSFWPQGRHIGLGVPLWKWYY